ncbi:levansucrase [Jannaschia sp. R86511]|uniref:levansucrase n=1 Tax=Jannaschia sp. R86511 TaxID=3093853 RepID=UPI0036D3F8CD
MLRLAEDWVWDFWFADDGERHHVFFLKAPRSLGDPDLRHFHVRVGHAVSDDLVDWELLPDALWPRKEPAFDDGTTWTGSVVRDDDGGWRMFYTGTSRAEDCLVQRIGVARSDDLTTWVREGTTALLEPDARWYETLDRTAWHDQAWRDPWVFRDPGGDGWHMLITARAATGPADDRGVIGHAWSPDLDTWQVRAPRSAPGAGFGHLEVPQVEVVDGRPVLLFSCPGVHLSAARRAQGVDGGVWWLDAPSLVGPFDASAARLLSDERLYSGRLVQRRDGAWVWLGFENVDADGGFVGVIGDPQPVG